LLVERGYDADGFRDALKDKGIRPVSPVENNEFLLAARAQNFRKLAKICPAPKQMYKA